jgi:hypothetical protein
MDYGNDGLLIDLAPGYYRPVFIGSSSVGGTSEIVIHLWTATGLPITDFSKTTSTYGVSEHSFEYVYMSEPGQVQVFARASTSCGYASLSGAIAFERVAD